MDGFNLFHSLKAAESSAVTQPVRWLDVRSLCESVLYEVGGGARLERVVYFSAVAHWRDVLSPGSSVRHEVYLDALRSTGVEVRLGYFKKRPLKCPRCGELLRRHEEKETDVGIALELLDSCQQGACDSVVLVTGDSDLAPAFRVARARFPSVRLFAMFPFRRIGFELKREAHRAFRVGAHRYLQHRLPERIALPDGRILRPPEGW